MICILLVELGSLLSHPRGDQYLNGKVAVNHVHFLQQISGKRCLCFNKILTIVG